MPSIRDAAGRSLSRELASSIARTHFQLDLVQLPVPGAAEALYKRIGCAEKPPPALGRILERYSKGPKALKTVLIEHYHSTDWADEYQAFHARSFRPVPRDAVRLHLFSGVEGGRALEPADLTQLDEVTSEAYLGYVVLRPLLGGGLGDTVLQPPDFESDVFVPCKAEFTPHILGYELNVRAMPYFQADSLVSVCAEANLWMLARFLHARGEGKRYRPSEMEKLAGAKLLTGPTAGGLASDQLWEAVRGMGVEAEKLDIEDRQPTSAAEAIHLLYTSVNSQLPVMVGVTTADGPLADGPTDYSPPDHLVTVIGYRYGKPNGTPELDHSTARYVDAFVVHDDNTEPYKTLAVGAVEVEGFELLRLENHTAHFFVFPKPPRVHLDAEDVRLMAESWLETGLSSLGADLPDADECARLATRCYLRRGDAFKKDLTKGRPRNAELVARYWSMALPKYVWVVELSEADSWAAPATRRIVGEMLIDPTASKHDALGALLAVHVRGRMIHRGQVTQAGGLFADPRPWVPARDLGSEPYDPFFPAP